MSIRFKSTRRGVRILLMLGASCPLALAAEHVTLRNGFELDCVRREVAGDKVRLFLAASGTSAAPVTETEANFLEVPAASVLRVETLPDLPRPAAAAVLPQVSERTLGAAMTEASLTTGEMNEMLSRAGAKHNIDADLLSSLVKAESGGRIRAVSRTGARGLMQLMPGTASGLGVKDAFRPEENIAGGTAYLDQLLTRYHDNMALALAAYNAGPGAVDRWRGVPPYRETRAYVARVIREFNRRKMMLVATSK